MNIFANLTNGYSAFMIFLSRIEAGSDGPVKYVAQEIAFLEYRICVLFLSGRVQGFGLKADTSDPKAKRKEVSSQLFGCLVVKQVARHRRFQLSTAACLFIKKQNMIICNKLW